MALKYRFPLVSLIALGIAMPVMAQEAAAPQAPAAEPGRDVVVVTANKREESVQDIAVAVTAVTSEMRDELGISTITDLTNLTPGLQYTAGNERITLRGIGRNTNNFGAEPGVANYTDGIYQSFASIAGRDNIFIDRIEVLRGPQGTLYGRNSIGGALNIISKRPTDEFKGEFMIGAGNFDSMKAGMSVSGPLTDWLRGRAVLFKEQRSEGVFKNLGTGDTEGYNINNWNGEVQLEGDLGDRLSFWTKYTTGRYDNAGPPGGRTTGNSDLPYDTVSFGSLSGTGAVTPNQYWAFGSDPRKLGFTQCGSTTTNPGVTDPRVVNNCGSLNSKLDAYNDFAAEVVYEAGPFDIKYVGGAVYYNYVLTGDQDGTPITSITYNSTSFGAPAPIGTPGSASRTIRPSQTLRYNENRAFFSNELNFISTNDSDLQWIGGIYAYQENFKQPVSTFFKDEPLAASAQQLSATYVPLSLSGTPNPDREASYTNNTGLNNSYGVFGQFDWQFTDSLKATVGLRYSVDNKHIQEEARLYCFIQCSFSAAYLPYTNVTRAIWNGSATGFVGPQPGVTGATALNPTGITYTANGTAQRLLENEWDALTGTAGLEWKPNSDTLGYAKYSRGYKTGGFNATSMAPLPMTDEETVNAYELGWKQDFRAINLTANTSLFFYDYQGVQTPVTVQPDPLTPGVTYTAFVNIPKVETSGLEVESTWRPVDDLSVRLTYAYLNAEIAESGLYRNSLTGVVQSVEGNNLPQSPKNKVAANVSYDFNFADGSSLTPSVSWYWRDGFNGTIFANAQEETPSFQQTDARLIWNDADGFLTVIGYVRNAFDEEGYDLRNATTRRSTDVTQNGLIGITDTLTLPRTYGVELQVHF